MKNFDAVRLFAAAGEKGAIAESVFDIEIALAAFNKSLNFFINLISAVCHQNFVYAKFTTQNKKIPVMK